LIHAKKGAKYETCNKKSNVPFKLVSSAQKGTKMKHQEERVEIPVTGLTAPHL
jgi:hypothetical protein